MKYLVPLILFLAIPGFAQTDIWQRVNSPHGGECIEVFQYPNGRVIACFGSVDISRAEYIWYSKMENDTVWQLEPGMAVLVNAWYTIENTVYIQTREDVYRRSTDNGQTWTNLLWPIDGFPVQHPLTKTLFLANAVDMFRSTDDGASWTQLSVPYSDIRFEGVDLNGDLLVSNYASIESADAEWSRSSDLGATWHADTAFPFLYLLTPIQRISPTTAFVLGRLQNGNSSFVYGLDDTLFVTQDNGNTWRKVGYFGKTASVGNQPLFGGNLLLYTTERSYAIVDTTTWQVRESPQPPGRKGGVSVLSASGMLCRATTNGLYTSRDLGNTWKVETDGIFARARHIGFLPNNDVFVTSNFHGFLRTSNLGATWDAVASINDEIHGCIPCGQQGALFLALYNQNALLRSTDGFQTWDTVQVDNPYMLWCRRDKRLYTGDRWIHGIQSTDDEGMTWTTIEGPDCFVRNRSRFVVSNNGVVVADVDRYLPQYDNWIEMTFPYNTDSRYYVNSMYIDSQERVYMVRVGSGTLRHVVNVSDDEGLTWRVVLDVQSTNRYHGADIIADTYGNIYLLISDGVIYRTTNRGESWTALNSPHPTIAGFESFALDKDGYFWAVTVLEGIFRSSGPLAVESASPVATTPALSIYPNPAVNTGSVTASITLDEINTGPLTLEIVNELGEVLHTQQLHTDGRRHITASIPLGNLSNGYYVARIIGQGNVMQQGVAVFRR